MGGHFYLNYRFRQVGDTRKQGRGGRQRRIFLILLVFCPPHLPLGYELTGTLVKIRESLGIIIWV
jgi:hypothetical protein